MGMKWVVKLEMTMGGSGNVKRQRQSFLVARHLFMSQRKIEVEANVVARWSLQCTSNHGL